MKIIYILLTRSATVLSRIVHLATKAPYTHVSISFDETLNTLYSSSRKNGRTLFPAGPCRESLYGGYLGRHPDMPCTLYELEVSDEVYEAAQQAAEAILHNAAHYRFNIVGMIFCQLRIPYDRAGHYFCSQLVGEILVQSRAVELPTATSLMRPMDYTHLPELTCRFSGNLLGLMQYCAAEAKTKPLTGDRI